MVLTMNQDKVYELATLTAEHNSSKIYLEKGSFFSVQTLQVCGKFGDAAERKSPSRKEASLMDILKSAS